MKQATMAFAISRLRMGRSRWYSTLDLPPRKVTVLGAGGAVGEPLSMLLKMNPFISHLALYDAPTAPASVAGVATDVSHMSTIPQVTGYMGEEQLGKALEGSDIVIIPASVPRKPSMPRDEFFKINAGIVKSLCTAIAKHCPEALINMMCNPLNSTVLIAAEVLKKAGTYNEKKLFGVTMFDVVRAKTLYAAKTGFPVKEVDIPVVGGHSGITILPLFSQATPKPDTPLSDEDIKALTKLIQDEGTDAVAAKEVQGSAKLSMAFAGAKFADTCLAGLDGVQNVVDYAFVQSSISDLPFFASRVRLGKDGIEEVLGLGSLSEFEQECLETMKPELKSSIEKGLKFGREN